MCQIRDIVIDKYSLINLLPDIEHCHQNKSQRNTTFLHTSKRGQENQSKHHAEKLAFQMLFVQDVYTAKGSRASSAKTFVSSTDKSLHKHSDTFVTYR